MLTTVIDIPQGAVVGFGQWAFALFFGIIKTFWPFLLIIVVLLLIKFKMKRFAERFRYNHSIEKTKIDLLEKIEENTREK